MLKKPTPKRIVRRTAGKQPRVERDTFVLFPTDKPNVFLKCGWDSVTQQYDRACHLVFSKGFTDRPNDVLRFQVPKDYVPPTTGTQQPKGRKK